MHVSIVQWIYFQDQLIYRVKGKFSFFDFYDEKNLKVLADGL